MSIENVFFPGEGSRYCVDDVVQQKPNEAAAERITTFLEENPEGIVWAFYKHFAIPRRKAITRAELIASSDRLLPDVRSIYIQLCDGRPPQGIGYERTQRGTLIGHYDF